MGKTSRLFLLMQVLRGHQRPVTADQWARRLSVSARTLYRDAQALVALVKIAATSPKELRERIADIGLWARRPQAAQPAFAQPGHPAGTGLG